LLQTTAMPGTICLRRMMPSRDAVKSTLNPCGQR
jgi:hypothetical protein